MRTLRLLPVLCALLPALAGEAERQVAWVGDWDQAFDAARESGRPVMVCINSKDGEKANEATATGIYHDPEFVALSRDFVMVVISTRRHRAEGECPRFKKVTCEQHLTCWKELNAKYGERLSTASAKGEMISPQHVWIAPDGTLLRRKEYWLDKAELMRRMRKVLATEDGGGEAVAPGPKDAPLDEKDRAELARLGTADLEGRRAAVGNLLATEKIAAHQALVELLKRSRIAAVRCDILRGLGRARVLGARGVIEELLGDKNELVRSFAAVALEDLGQHESVAPLLKRSRSERDTTARKNVYRALGGCGGPYADKGAAKRLLKALGGDKQKVVRKHAALALKQYGTTAEATRLVLKKLEQAALKTKDREVRGAIIYTLAYLGDTKTTLPVLEKILDQLRDDFARLFVREAIRVLKRQATEFGRSARFLFREDNTDPART